MYIQKFSQSPFLYNQFKEQRNKELKIPKYTTDSKNISFEARVNKGLTRFYETNAHRMPLTLNKYIQKLADKTAETPLQAQKNAFITLMGATSIEVVKTVLFPDEKLFQDLKNPSETKATRGILSIYRENKELLDLYNKSILKNKENLTLWILKKIFLEGKTIDEINKDFDIEADEDFKALYKEKESSNNYIKFGTLKALGIKLPEFEYLQSLRYTREGYSDLVGEKISQAQREFYATLPIEERTARARKSVEKFETWWNSMSHDQHLEIIAFKMNELEMLENFNNSKIGKRPKISAKSKEYKQTLNKHEKVKVESTLSRDDLFKIWATTNLKIFEANLTDYDKTKIEAKREQRRAEWWDSMSAQERTDYINKLRSSAEPLRFAMIDAWNNNQDILVELSHYLSNKHIKKPLEILYGTEEFNKFFSESMTHFWESHPEFAEKLGESIRNSHEKIKNAMNDGRFEQIKRDISKMQIKRKKDVQESIKNYREILPEEIYETYPEYMQNFIDAYSKSNNADINILPIDYVRQYYEVISKEIDVEAIISWTKALNKENLTDEDFNNLQKIRDTETLQMAIISRTLEATLAKVLYDCTNNPDVYLLSHSDCKLAVKQINEGKKEINIYSLKLNKDFKIPVIENKIDVQKIDNLYNQYKKEVPLILIDSFIDHFIICNYRKITEMKQEKEITDYLRSYINTYRLSSMIICDGTRNFTSEVRAKFAEKFMSNLDPKYASLINLRTKSIEDFDREVEIERLMNQTRKKYYFLPKNMLDLYTYELSKIMRDSNNKDFEIIKENCCIAKKNINTDQRPIFLDRRQFRDMHALYSLAIEKTLSDILYEATGNENVYALKMEELFPIFETLMLAKKDSKKLDIAIYSMNLQKRFELSIKKRIQPYIIEKVFKEYHNEFTEYVNERFKNNSKISKEEILYILNPDETDTRVDEFMKDKIKESLVGNLFEE